MSLKYRESVLRELARHGVAPSQDTPPEMVHEFISDLYLYEIRSLKARMKAGLIPLGDYAKHVEALRNRYPLLSLPVRLWTEG
jgi:hypothetical protein